MSLGLRVFRGALLGGALALPACGGAQFDGRTFQNEELSFRVASVPGTWRSIDAPGTLLAFRDDRTPASISISGRCGKDGDDVPLEALTHHLFLIFTERRVESQTLTVLDGREALHTEMDAKLDGVPKHFALFVLKKNGCVYDFVHISPVGSGPELEGARKAFVSFVEQFSTVSP